MSKLVEDMKMQLLGKGKCGYEVTDIKEAFECVVPNTYDISIKKLNDNCYHLIVSNSGSTVTLVFEVELLENDWYSIKNIYVKDGE